jgi:hypothetical protein
LYEIINGKIIKAIIIIMQTAIKKPLVILGEVYHFP